PRRRVCARESTSAASAAPHAPQAPARSSLSPGRRWLVRHEPIRRYVRSRPLGSQNDDPCPLRQPYRGIEEAYQSILYDACRCHQAPPVTPEVKLYRGRGCVGRQLWGRQRRLRSSLFVLFATDLALTVKFGGRHGVSLSVPIHP